MKKILVGLLLASLIGCTNNIKTTDYIKTEATISGNTLITEEVSTQIIGKIRFLSSRQARKLQFGKVNNENDYLMITTKITNLQNKIIDISVGNLCIKNKEIEKIINNPRCITEDGRRNNIKLKPNEFVIVYSLYEIPKNSNGELYYFTKNSKNNIKISREKH